MANPGRIVIQVAILGSQILGKAFVQAWRQAARNAQGSGAGAQASNSAGGRAARGVDRTHGMTIDEAAQILNVQSKALAAKDPTELQKMLKNFDHLFAANAPMTAEGKPHSSHYLQSKIVRAKERIEADILAGQKVDSAAPPPPPPPSS